MIIDVFDFDGTIYDGDSTLDFVLFCIGSRPGLALCLVPPLLRGALRALSGRFSLTEFKSGFFSALARKVDLAAEGEAFWAREKTRKRLGAWFLERERDVPAVIASASPDFELAPAARLLGMDLVCTRCDAATGVLLSANCKGEEKARRLREAYGDAQVRAMYTDSTKADGPMLALAREGYLVRHGAVKRII